jgi:hypothetical protein
MDRRLSSGSAASFSHNRFSRVGIISSMNMHPHILVDDLSLLFLSIRGVLQNYARKYTIPIDKLAFEFDILQEDNDMAQKPDDGAYVKGLFLEGARWNTTTRFLDESLPKILFDVLPIIWLRPGVIEKFATVNTYSCPVYKV